MQTSAAERIALLVVVLIGEKIFLATFTQFMGSVLSQTRLGLNAQKAVDRMVGDETAPPTPTPSKTSVPPIPTHEKPTTQASQKAKARVKRGFRSRQVNSRIKHKPPTQTPALAPAQNAGASRGA